MQDLLTIAVLLITLAATTATTSTTDSADGQTNPPTSCQTGRSAEAKSLSAAEGSSILDLRRPYPQQVSFRTWSGPSPQYCRSRLY